MDDLFKKFINTGVGLVSQGNKAMQTAIEKLVKESKISEHEGKKIVDDLLKSSETKRHDLEKQFKTLTDDLKNRVGLTPEAKPTPSAKAKAAKPAAKAAAKKPATSATTQAAGTVKKAAAKVSTAAAKTQRSAAAKAGAAKKAPTPASDAKASS